MSLKKRVCYGALCFALLAAVILTTASAVWARDFMSYGFKYTVTGAGTVEVTGPTTSAHAGRLEIPSTVTDVFIDSTGTHSNTYEVTGVGDSMPNS